MAAQGVDLLIAEDVGVVPLRAPYGQGDELFGMRQGYGAEEDGVHDGEHGGDGAESDGQGEDHGGRVSGGVPEAADGVAKVAGESLQWVGTEAAHGCSLGLLGAAGVFNLRGFL